MKKRYENPEVNVEKFEVEDVITTSGGGGQAGSGVGGDGGELD